MKVNHLPQLEEPDSRHSKCTLIPRLPNFLCFPSRLFSVTQKSELNGVCCLEDRRMTWPSSTSPKCCRTDQDLMALSPSHKDVSIGMPHCSGFLLHGGNDDGGSPSDVHLLAPHCHCPLMCCRTNTLGLVSIDFKSIHGQYCVHRPHCLL